MESEFGKGFIYCLINFAKHFDKAYEMIEQYQKLREEHGFKKNTYSEEGALSLWINGASDHLYELVIPEQIPEELKKKVIKLQDTALDYGHGNKMLTDMSKDKYNELRELLNEIALGIDNWLKVDTEKAGWD